VGHSNHCADTEFCGAGLSGVVGLNTSI
jgi:hypothetical protein